LQQGWRGNERKTTTLKALSAFLRFFLLVRLSIGQASADAAHDQTRRAFGILLTQRLAIVTAEGELVAITLCCSETL
jgi:hypothetical protein